MAIENIFCNTCGKKTYNGKIRDEDIIIEIEKCDDGENAFEVHYIKPDNTFLNPEKYSTFDEMVTGVTAMATNIVLTDSFCAPDDTDCDDC